MSISTDQKDFFEKVALPQAESVYRFALHLCANESDAEDLTQECMHLAYRKFHQFQQGTNCKAWLFRITRNAYIDRLRQKAREPRASELPELPDARPDPQGKQSLLEWDKLSVGGERALYELFGDEVSRSLRDLPPEFRLAVVLCDVEQFSYSEIGEVLDCPVGTVRSRISRARHFLKEKLYEYAKDLGYVKSKGQA